jgi:NAD+ diphosphatase
VLLNLPLSRSELDRAAHLRGDEVELERLWKIAKIIDLLGDRFLSDGKSLTYLNSKEIAELPVIENSQIERYFLGLAEDGTPFFVAHRRSGRKEIEAPTGYETLRTIGANLDSLDIGAAVHALALSQWHDAHQRCAKCGAATRPTLGGSVRSCESCESDHHPRTDPAIIVLVKDKSDRILLGRQKVWPAKRFSTFAGFVEPGESFESAVIREVKEECGGEVTEMRYLGSQPWPFPASLMIAYEALISNPESVKEDGSEIEEILWLTREELARSVANQDLLLPPAISVARAMINSWYGPNATELVGRETWRN